MQRTIQIPQSLYEHGTSWKKLLSMKWLLLKFNANCSCIDIKLLPTTLSTTKRPHRISCTCVAKKMLGTLGLGMLKAKHWQSCTLQYSRLQPILQLEHGTKQATAKPENKAYLAIHPKKKTNLLPKQKKTTCPSLCIQISYFAYFSLCIQISFDTNHQMLRKEARI